MTLWGWNGRGMVVGWVIQTDGMGYGRGIGGAWSTVSEYRLDRRTVAGKIFRPVFRPVFSRQKKKKKKNLGMEWNVRDLIVCALVRLWLGFVRL